MIPVMKVEVMMAEPGGAGQCIWWRELAGAGVAMSRTERTVKGESLVLVPGVDDWLPVLLPKGAELSPSSGY